MNLQVIASPSGDVLWVSGALPGSVHDKKAEWTWGVLAELEAAGLVTLADKGYQGSATRRSRTRARTSRSRRKPISARATPLTSEKQTRSSRPSDPPQLRYYPAPTTRQLST